MDRIKVGKRGGGGVVKCRRYLDPNQMRLVKTLMICSMFLYLRPICTWQDLSQRYATNACYAKIYFVILPFT